MLLDRNPFQDSDARGLARRRTGYQTVMLYTILIILAIVALLLFIFGRRRV
jgi:LPXTG-motif cell wall-anchored protein